MDGRKRDHHMNVNENKKPYVTIDIAKFVMAILVVAIHVHPFSGEVAFVYDDIVARIADPLFFQITAFLFFEKVFREDKDIWRSEPGWHQRALSWQKLGHYMKRILQLYTAWFILYAPVVCYRTVQELGFTLSLQGMGRIVISLLRKYWLSGYYGAMWFMTALLFAMPLTFFVTKYLGPGICVLLSAPWFLLTVARMEYCSITDHWQVMPYCDHAIYGIFGWYANGLTYGFFFCALGMWMAYKRSKAFGATETAQMGIKNTDGLLPFFISFLLLIVEAHVIRDKNLGQSYGAMFFLIPTSYFLLRWLLSVEILNEKSKICTHLRRLSIMIFAIHYGVMELLQFGMETYTTQEWNTTVLYFVVLAVTIGCAELLLLLQKKIKWLHVLY